MLRSIYEGINQKIVNIDYIKTLETAHLDSNIYVSLFSGDSLCGVVCLDIRLVLVSNFITPFLSI